MQASRFLLIVAVAAMAVLPNCGGPGAAEAPATVAEAAGHGERTPAAPFTLEASDGKQVSLSDYEGKVVLLNFWATWCGPCKIEMPWFVDFQRKYKDQGFTVLAVSLDEGGWDVVRPFADDMKLNFPVLLGDDNLAQQYGGIVALPTTIIIDKQGRIASQHTGLVSKSDYEDDIENLL